MIDNTEKLTEIINIERCARCGEDHPATFRKFREKPMVCGGQIYTHWGLCPVSRDPILLVKSEDLNR